jgi:hypothetical protein
MGSRMHESKHTHTIVLLAVIKWRGAQTHPRLMEPRGPRYLDVFQRSPPGTSATCDVVVFDLPYSGVRPVLFHLDSVFIFRMALGFEDDGLIEV